MIRVPCAAELLAAAAAEADDAGGAGPDYPIDRTAAPVPVGPDGRGLAAVPHGAAAADTAAAVRHFMTLEDGGG